MATDKVMAHRILEVLIKELGLTNIVGMVASVASLEADRVEADQGDIGDEARNWRRDSQDLRGILPRLRH
ncbi:MAG TPA: hypothetical protein V6D29_06205 [Leptolyngbyaceae cyanobacterium]